VRDAGPGTKRVVLAASGYLVHSCLKAAEALADQGIAATVVDAYALPMDTAPVLALAGQGRAILAVEDNYVGGLGSELAEAAAAMDGGPRVHGLAVRNVPKSGRTPDDVLAYVHLAVSDIVAAAAGLAR
jgi:transketolase